MKKQTNLIIHKETLPFLNISLYLNDHKPVKSLSIENTSAEDSAPVEITIQSDHPSLQPFSYSIARIPAGKHVQVPLDGLQINRKALSDISETEKAVLTISVAETDVVAATETIPLNIHTFDYFNGFQILPELIATYVIPNHSYIYHIKRKAIEILKKQDLPTAFEGYRSDHPERTLQIMSAIYLAIQNEEIAYSAMAPGYEETGQRLRLPGTIQREKFGNCLDLSLLFAACLEAAALHPLIIITRGHAFVGCWLVDDKFPEIVNDDKAAITKRLSRGIREIAVVEATTVCQSANPTRFSDAFNLGEAQLVEKEDFILSIDIASARTSRIRPLPFAPDEPEVLSENKVLWESAASGMENAFDIGPIYEDELLSDKRPQTRQKIWERKLLDLSLRNNLLNLRMTRNMLQLVDIDIRHLEDTLSEGKSFSIMADPKAEILRRYNLLERPLHHSSPLYQTANDELRYNRLLTYYHQQDLDHILTYIHKNARQSIEENGSSTLYLAVGLLKWYDRKTPEQARYAPILLLPVEIGRRSVNSRFTLKSREEEAMINITLIEFLRQEYELNLSALEQLPSDDNGVDVAKVMSTLRRGVMELKGWDVEERLVLGNFSFNKLILWKDIVAYQDELLQSDIVRGLVEGKSLFTDRKPLTDTNFDILRSHSLALPIAADASQTEAVLTARQGHSFILHGPPGTGKSQTITNIIADALYQGKKVLFVSAKKAALDVVYRRLEQIGLAPFSLELHSNKSKKTDVLEQLNRSLETTRVARSADFEREAHRLDEARKAISDYVNLLHEKQKAGWSLYDSIAAMESYARPELPKKQIPETSLNQLDPELWRQWTSWLARFQAITSLIIHPKRHPLASFKPARYTLAIHETIAERIKDLLARLPTMEKRSRSLMESIHWPFSIQSREEWNRFVEVARTLRDIPDMDLDLCHYLSDRENYETYQKWRQTYGQYQSLLQSILGEYNRSVLDLDLQTIELRWKQARQSWLIPRWLGKRAIRKRLNLYRDTTLNDDSDVEQLFASYNQLRELSRQATQTRYDVVRDTLKNLYRDEQTDLDDIERKTSIIKRLGDSMNRWGHHAAEKWIRLLQAKNIRYTGEVRSGASALLEDFIKETELFFEQAEDFETLTGAHLDKSDNWLSETTAWLNHVLSNLPLLKDWMNYIQSRDQGESLYLHWMIEAYESEAIQTEDFQDYFHYATHASIARKVISERESLSLFNAGLFESKIEQYKKIAKDFQNLTIQELRVRLASQLPNTAMEAMQSSEIGILRRAIKSRGRGLSIRRLFEQTSNLLPRVAPCMLMSPISVAQYFDVDSSHFDLVIFDEASQLPTCEAVSALARAKQAIIVGDPKQMPPTSFFSTTKLDEENMDIEDLESILDDCLALSIPSRYLSRHYRSRHESLIAFSNINYYDNKLLTFPSADDLNRKTRYHHVNGFYDKGGTRSNAFEADAIIDYIRTHYSQERGRERSLGVVTFSQAQQNLIEDKLQDMLSRNPSIEETIVNSEEPLFIKNLENVQGDERDIILFSIGYGPDESGKISMNFGPLNREGGWRRLNVAITRARYEMRVFATLKADQIDLSRTTSEGVAGLKAFLQFAENGLLPIHPEDARDMVQRRELSEVIGERLREKGLELRRNIGTSNFRIDIGIAHPDKPQEYILGIIVDGYYYFQARSANDREVVTPSVLQGLGWNIHRVWSLDWYENSKAIVDAIVDKVKSLRTGSKTQPEPPVISTRFTLEALETPRIEPALANTRQKAYENHTLKPISRPYGSGDLIYDSKNRGLLTRQIQAIVKTEAPISKNLLYKKLLQEWNMSRTTPKLDSYLEYLIGELNLPNTIHHQPFYWNPGQKTEPDFYRDNTIEKRAIEDIAPEEIMVALDEIVSQSLSIDEEELIRHTARIFGFAKTGRQIDTLLRYAIDLMVKTGKYKREGERIKVSG